jgi:DNA repair photolyase
MAITSRLPIHPFQTSLETLRGHHWMYFTDVYRGCQFSCAYCLYRGPADYGAHVQPMTGHIDGGRPMLDTRVPGILDVGATTDPYQPLEHDEQRTRALLHTLLDLEQPVFLLTRGELVERDADVLAQLGARGLVEVCFSLISLDPQTTEILEGRTPLPERRLAAARALSDRGVPVSFHLAPLIPGLYGPGELDRLVHAMAAAGGRHVFGAILGARPGFWSGFVTALETLRPARFHDWDAFRDAYPPDMRLDAAEGAATGTGPAVVDCTRELRHACDSAGLPFVSETVPGLSSATLTGGIYRWKMPTVYDMASWIRAQARPVHLATFDRDYYQAFAPSAALRSLVAQLWQDSSLFQNTAVQRHDLEGQVAYSAGATLQTGPTRTLTVRRSGGAG